MTPPRQRGWLEVRWRQARNPPPPVLRAVLANLAVASLGAALLLIYEIAIARGASLPGGDLRTPLVALYVAVVMVAGTLLTYLWVELPTGLRGERRRSGWSAMLGLFAAMPICYLALVVTFQIIRPLLG